MKYSLHFLSSIASYASQILMCIVTMSCVNEHLCLNTKSATTQEERVKVVVEFLQRDKLSSGSDLLIFIPIVFPLQYTDRQTQVVPFNLDFLI